MDIPMENQPYFKKNKEWYYYDEKEGCWKLTDKATPEAIKSYEEWYAPKYIEGIRVH